jgi:hypothetical protein
MHYLLAISKAIQDVADHWRIKVFANPFEMVGLGSSDMV